SLADPCLYKHPKRDIILLVYVDDLAASAKTRSELDWFFLMIKRRFPTKDLGEISKILGIRITRNRVTREIFLDQEEYLQKVLVRMNLPSKSSFTPKLRPTPISGKYSKLEPATLEEERTDLTTYQQHVGSVMFAIVETRPDIAFITGQLSQQLRDPAERHSSGMRDLGRYLQSTINQKIRYRLVADLDSNLKLYSDADWANIQGRKSISGHVAMLYKGPVAWGSKKQRSVAMSSTESEYIGMSSCAKQGQWIAQVLRDISFPKFVGLDLNCVDIRADNQGAIALTKNPHLHERSKHIDIYYYYIRDLAKKKRISVTYIPTVEMVADGFTKPLERILFIKFKSMLGLVDSNAKSQ
ncbi:Retrovirus-related Pol polyprotein from transposon TNT 1-94, partial [Lachnellula suecica]